MPKFTPWGRGVVGISPLVALGWLGGIAFHMCKCKQKIINMQKAKTNIYPQEPGSDGF